jgi:hypothetical protein
MTDESAKKKFKVGGWYKMELYVEFEVETDSEDNVENFDLEGLAHEEAYKRDFEPDRVEFDLDLIEPAKED